MASGLKKTNLVPKFEKISIIQKNSDRTTQQTSAIFRDKMNNTTVKHFGISKNDKI